MKHLGGNGHPPEETLDRPFRHAHLTRRIGATPTDILTLRKDKSDCPNKPNWAALYNEIAPQNRGDKSATGRGNLPAEAQQKRLRIVLQRTRNQQNTLIDS